MRSQCIMNSSWVYQALTQLLRITFIGPITCSVISFPLALLISTKLSSYHVPVSTWKHLESNSCMKSANMLGHSTFPHLCIMPYILGAIHLALLRTWTWMFTCVALCGFPSFSMESMSCTQCLTSVNKAWSWLREQMILFLLDSTWITTMKTEYGNFARLPLAFLHFCSPKSVVWCMWPPLPILLPSWISLAHILVHISIHCQQIQSVLWNFFNGS